MSAGINHSHRSPSGNRQMRRLLNRTAHAAVRTRAVFSSCSIDGSSARLGHAQADRRDCASALSARCGRYCTTASRMRNAARSQQGADTTASRQMLRELRSLGYRVELTPAPSRMHCDGAGAIDRDFRPGLVRHDVGCVASHFMPYFRSHSPLSSSASRDPPRDSNRPVVQTSIAPRWPRSSPNFVPMSGATSMACSSRSTAQPSSKSISTAKGQRRCTTCGLLARASPRLRSASQSTAA